MLDNKVLSLPTKQEQHKKTTYPSDLLDFSSNNLGNQILTCLQKNRVCMIHNVPQKIAGASEKLLAIGNAFINSYYSDPKRESHFEKSAGIIDPYGCKGFFPAKKYFANCNNGDRIFLEISNDINGTPTIKNNTIPALKKDQMALIDATYLFSSFTQSLVETTLKKIEETFNLKKNVLQTAILKGCSINMTRYQPITQTRLKEIFNDNKLHIIKRLPVTIRQFEPHSDICPITILCYPNGNFSGLEGEYSGKFLPFQIPNSCQGPTFILFAGQQLEVLTNGNIKPLIHQVTTTANAQCLEAERSSNNLRFVLGHFSFYYHEMIGPAPTEDAKIVEPPIGSSSFQSVKTAEAVWRHDRDITNSAEKILPEDVLAAFPKISRFERETGLI